MRIKSLDSVRGIAAFMVVVGHCIGTIEAQPRWLQHFPFTLLNAGDSAVIMFFALSGCVLFLSLQQKSSSAYFGYLSKRFMRIYPTFVVAVLVSAVLFEVVRPRPVPGVSDWFNAHWQSAPTLGMLLGHLAMTDLPALRQLDAVMWSLVQELRISVIFPFIALWVVADWRAAVLVTAALSAVCTFVELHAHITWMFDPILTLSYVYLFAAGAALASHAHTVRRLGRLPRWLQLGLWLVALRLVAVPVERDVALATGAGALLIIALAFGTPVSDRVLSTHNVLIWLGRVSYSLYLVHWPIIMTCVHLLRERLPLIAILAIAVAMSLAAAELMNRLIEQPSIALGRRFASLPALQRTFAYRGKVASGDI